MRRRSTAVLVGLLLPILLVGLVPVALAEHGGADPVGLSGESEDGGSNYGHCNVSYEWVDDGSSITERLIVRLACQHSFTEGTITPGGWVTVRLESSNNATNPEITDGIGADCGDPYTEHTTCVTTDSGGQYRAMRSLTTSAFGGFPSGPAEDVSCTEVQADGGADGPCKFLDVDHNSAAEPPMPFHAWELGSSGDLTLDDIEGTCEIEGYDAQGPGTEGIAYFSIDVTNGQDGATDEVEWDFGDGSPTVTAEPDEEVAHSYGTISFGDSWTVVATVTRSDDSDPGNTTDETCELEVDFFEPVPPPSTIGDDGTGEDEDDGRESCSAWDVPCWLRRLFIPDTDSLGDTWSGFYSTLEEKWPVAPVIWAGGVLDDATDAVSGGYNGAPGTGILGVSTWDSDVDDGIDDGWVNPETGESWGSEDGSDPCATGPIVFNEEGFEGVEAVQVPILESCANSPISFGRTWSRRVSTVMFVLLGVLGLVALGRWVVGGDEA